MKDLQKDEIDQELRNRLWNALKVFYWDNYERSGTRSYVQHSNFEGLCFAYWHRFFKWPLDEMPGWFSDVRAILREQFFAFSWYRVYDFIEFTIDNGQFSFARKFPEVCNQILEEENAAYRLIDGQVIQITSPVEIQTIEDLLAKSGPFPGVRVHISAALKLLSDRENPDYRNSIKESISAVESACQTLVGDEKATLGAALKVLEAHMELHSAFKAGLSNLYGYTSDAAGIRHAILEESKLTFSDAKFMLVGLQGYNVGYRCFNLIRASFVSNCQSIRCSPALRSAAHASTSRSTHP